MAIHHHPLENAEWAILNRVMRNCIPRLEELLAAYRARCRIVARRSLSHTLPTILLVFPLLQATKSMRTVHESRIQVKLALLRLKLFSPATKNPAPSRGKAPGSVTGDGWLPAFWVPSYAV